MIEFCKNCSCETTGLYCAHCGQSTSTKRINWAFFTKEFLFNNFTFHKGMLFTVKSLILHPRKMLTDYLEGKRVGYTGAVQFFLFILIFKGLVSLIRGDAAADSNYTTMINGVETAIDLQKYMKPLIIIYTIISSLGNYLVYRSRKYNLAEHFVINFYIIGLVFLTTSLFDIFTFYKLTDYNYIPILIFGIASYMRIFYDKKIRIIDFFKALWCLTLNLILALIVLVIYGFTYAFYIDMMQDAVKTTLDFRLTDIFLS